MEDSLFLDKYYFSLLYFHASCSYSLTHLYPRENYIPAHVEMK